MQDHLTARLTTLVFGINLILLIGYYYNDPFVIADSFHALRFVLYIFVPLILNQTLLKIPLRDLGFSRPKWDRKVIRWLVVIAITAPLVVALVRLNPNYLREYSYYQNSQTGILSRLTQWLIFTFSTLIGWEWMLRGFLLFGLRYLLVEEGRVKDELAQRLAILTVMTVEVLYHLVKPDLEAFAMLAASPLLSWIAFRSRSFWPALLSHLYIELVFIAVLFA
jgi:hypothetical protein